MMLNTVQPWLAVLCCEHRIDLAKKPVQSEINFYV